MNDAEGVDVCEAGEEVVKVGFHLLGGEGRVLMMMVIVKDDVEVKGEEREYEGEFPAG